MKIRLLVSLALVVVALHAAAAETVLTSDSVVYTIDGSVEATRLLLSRRVGDTAIAVPVPSTEDDAIEAEPRLLWDDVGSNLYVAWIRRGGDDVLLARLDAQGQWSAPITIARGAHCAGLQIVLSRAEAATFVHAAWWSLAGRDAVAQYALVAYEGGEYASTAADTLDALAPSDLAKAASDVEDTGAALHPPLALARSATGVDVVYGSTGSTALRRLSIEPRRIVGNARAWRPVGRTGENTGRTGLVSSNSAPVQVLVRGSRIVLYTPGAQFRYMVYDAGQWSRLYTLRLDDSVKSEQLVDQLRTH
ncbi:MAG TPA: hypothetical protein VJZ00_18820 [Thermoanaerobaculia bacterium]|nr:hypothetical protein [Thermoanaerobaculia bacterium]